jgi:hypothetical protein
LTEDLYQKLHALISKKMQLIPLVDLGQANTYWKSNEISRNKVLADCGLHVQTGLAETYGNISR